MAVFAQRAILSVTSYRPEAARRYTPRPVDGSSTRGGSTSVRGRVRSPHISGGRPAAGSQRAYSLGWDRQTDGRIAVLRNAPPPLRRRHNNCSYIYYLDTQCDKLAKVAPNKLILLNCRCRKRHAKNHATFLSFLGI